MVPIMRSVRTGGATTSGTGGRNRNPNAPRCPLGLTLLFAFSTVKRFSCGRIVCLLPGASKLLCGGRRSKIPDDEQAVASFMFGANSQGRLAGKVCLSMTGASCDSVGICAPGKCTGQAERCWDATSQQWTIPARTAMVRARSLFRSSPTQARPDRSPPGCRLPQLAPPCWRDLRWSLHRLAWLAGCHQLSGDHAASPAALRDQPLSSRSL